MKTLLIAILTTLSFTVMAKSKLPDKCLRKVLRELRDSNIRPTVEIEQALKIRNWRDLAPVLGPVCDENNSDEENKNLTIENIISEDTFVVTARVKPHASYSDKERLRVYCRKDEIKQMPLITVQVKIDKRDKEKCETLLTDIDFTNFSNY